MHGCGFIIIFPSEVAHFRFSSFALCLMRICSLFWGKALSLSFFFVYVENSHKKEKSDNWGKESDNAFAPVRSKVTMLELAIPQLLIV